MPVALTLPRPARRLVPAVCALLWLAGVSGAGAAPEGTLTIGMHFTPVTRWLDPAEGESTITPFFLLYALHDGLLKPMPGTGSGPSLAESWAMSKDMQSGRAWTTSWPPPSRASTCHPTKTSS